MLETDKVIKRFRDYVIQQARSNLSKSQKNNTRGLYESLKGEIVNDKDFTIVGFQMIDYGDFVDKGVRGKTSSAKAPNSPYKFGSGTGRKGGLTEGINKWVRQKGFQFRDKKTGRFLSFNSTAYLITRSIFHKGIKPSLFFTKPFEVGFKRFVDVDILEAFGKDVETIIDFNIKSKE